ncbi:MAG: hypothetical protein GF411_10215 [Candidatus Lokiarchaeota archaeon]|nr:hypothetical protein [Candidatus Lokiarchaeota archaeon]
MKSVPLYLMIGIHMESKTIDSIVPASAAKGLQLAGGSMMEQAIPEDYVMASILLNALEERNGMDLEFFLKAYLPIHVIKSPTTNWFALIERLGLASSTIPTYSDIDFKSFKTALNSALTIESLGTVTSDLDSELNKIIESNSLEVPGLMSGAIADAVSIQLDWPYHTNLESYAFSFPSMIEDSELAEHSEKIKRTLSLLDSASTHIRDILQTLEERSHILLTRMEQGHLPKIERLDQRIRVLEVEIENIEHKISSGIGLKEELKQISTARKKALKRDISRRKALIAEMTEKSSKISSDIDSLTNKAQTVLTSINSARESLDSLLVGVRSANIPKEGVCLLFPFFVVGYSKKGQLRLNYYPPSRLKDNDERVGIRRDFVYPFFFASESYSELISLLEKRISSDISLRKSIRSHAKDNNLLALAHTRKMIIEGTKSLLADGLVKESKIEDIVNLLDVFPEKSPVERFLTDGAFVADSEELCSVKFHICDESGRAIENATLELGVLSMESDERGGIRISLPMSHYDGIVSAAGFHEKTLEFSIKSTNDIVIPVVLAELSREDRLDRSLDSLVAKAERIEGIRRKLLEIFEKQGEMLLSVPAYRSALVELLSELGYDPESWISEALSKKGMVQRLLKRNDRIDGMQRDILRLASESRNFGGIMLFSELLISLDELGWNTNPDEVEDILSSMIKEGLVDGLTTLKDGIRVVQFIPVALTHDPRDLLGLAAKKDGKLTIEDVVVNLEWTEERARNAFDLLVSKGVAKLQKSYARSTIYWFPGLRGKK